MAMDGVNPMSGSGGTSKTGKLTGVDGQKRQQSLFVFSNYDENKDGVITVKEMGLKKILDKILKSLPETAKSTEMANIIEKIRNVATALQNSFTYSDINSAEMEVKQRIEDTNKLVEIAKDLNEGKENDDYNSLELKSIAAQDADKNHNPEMQMEQALNDAVTKAMANAGKVEVKDLNIETMQGLIIENVDVSPKVRCATGTENDERKEKGIERGIDGIVVTLTYNYLGEVKTLKKVVDEVPAGYQAPENVDLFDERSTNVTFGKKFEKEFD